MAVIGIPTNPLISPARVKGKWGRAKRSGVNARGPSGDPVNIGPQDGKVGGTVVKIVPPTAGPTTGELIGTNLN